MNKNCENCEYGSKSIAIKFADGLATCKDEWKEEIICTRKSSTHWYRKVNNLITCDEWSERREKHENN